MFRSFIESIFSKGFSAIGNFVVVILTAQVLGAEGRGEVTLLLLTTAIVGLIQNIFGNSTIAYYALKISSNRLLLISFMWLLLTSITVPFILNVFNLCIDKHLVYVIILSLILGLISIFQGFLLGNEKIRAINVIDVLKSVIVLLVLLIQFYGFNSKTIEAVFFSFIFSYSICLLVSFFFSFKLMGFSYQNDFKADFNEMFKTGFELQVNNLLQLINYRFTYYIISSYFGLAALGIVSVAVSIAEAIWIVCKSASVVLYAKLLNEEDAKIKFDLTINYTKISYLLTFLLSIVLLLVPANWYQFLFGEDFGGLNELLFYYFPSILFLSFFTLLNHYFSAHNLNKVNIKATFLGNIIVVSLSVLIIPIYGINSSGLVLGIAYLSMSLFLLYRFRLLTNSKISSFFTNFKSIRSLLNNG